MGETRLVKESSSSIHTVTSRAFTRLSHGLFPSLMEHYFDDSIGRVPMELQFHLAYRYGRVALHTIRMRVSFLSPLGFISKL